MSERAGDEAAIGYVVMGYPRLSESFISNEILQLEALGARLHVFAVKPGEDERVHASVEAVRAPIEYLPRATSLSGTSFWRWLSENLPRFRAAHGRVFRAHPLRWLATLGAALAMSLRYRRSPFAAPRKVFIKEFLQAGVIADRVAANPGIAHLHGHFCHGATTITWFASRLADVPFSFTAHAKDIYQRDQNPGDLLTRKIAAARFVATCTESNRQHLAARCPDATHVHTIYHGLDTAYFQRSDCCAAHGSDDLGGAATGFDAAAPLVLAIGRFVEKKGLRFLVDALAQVRDTGQAFRAVLVGEDGGEAQALREQVVRLGLEPCVEFAAPMDHSRLRQLYGAASLFVLPCLVAADGDRDGIPNVIAEAMSMGLPVVTTSVSGIPELVADGHNGVVVPERDAGAIADAICGLLHDPARRDAIGRAARDTICERFDSRSTTRALLELFHQEMQRGGASASSMCAEVVRA
jgi:glycosyltransferase involved in cell wall biosynthesis